tara:strand:+ start:108215 stop:108925 length:711 start_codon:yes stop_codon:yes gene_type:complete
MIESQKHLVRNFLSLKKTESSAFKWSLATLGLCYLMSFLYWSHPQGELLQANPAAVFGNKEYWRLFTSSFIHGDLKHFLSNSLMLGVMGYFVNYHYGKFIFPMIGFLSGIFINLIVIWDYPPNASLVGASGVVHWLWGFWLVLYIAIQRNIPLQRRIMKVMVVGLVVLLPTEFNAQTSYYAHGVGLALGLITGLVYFFFNAKKIYSHEKWEQKINIIDDELVNEAIGEPSGLNEGH